MGLEHIFPDFAQARATGFAGLSCPKPTLMIAITPRTGSTFLCTALHEAGLGFEPNEIFNPRGPVQQECAQRRVNDFTSYIASIAASPVPCFAFKTSWHDAAPLAPCLTSLFPQLHVLYLDRRNIAAQAVSHWRAEVTDIWHVRPGTAPPKPDLQALAQQFDITRIARIIQNLEREKQGWEGWFAAQGITPLRLEYRQLETDMRAAVRRIASALNLALHPDRVTGKRTERLADALNAAWVERVQKHLFNLS